MLDDIEDEDIMASVLQQVIAPIRTKDCVQIIVSDPAYSDTKAKDWKRQSKKKNEQGQWVRTFINKTTGQSVQVLETTSGLTIIGLVVKGSNPLTEDFAFIGTDVHPVDTAGDQNSPIYYVATLITAENCEEFAMGFPDFVGHYSLGITTRDYWESDHCMIDYTPDWLSAMLGELNFPPEEMESIYTISPELMQVVCNSPNFYQHPDFVAFMGQCES